MAGVSIRAVRARQQGRNMKTVVITGSTRGIGRGLAENFLARGCKVVVSGRQAEGVAAVVTELAGRHGEENVAGKACDISDGSQLQGLWDEAASRFGRVDIWINNAGAVGECPYPGSHAGTT